jgi:DNA-3-methyladenine glycosylase I
MVGKRQGVVAAPAAANWGWPMTRLPLANAAVLRRPRRLRERAEPASGSGGHGLDMGCVVAESAYRTSLGWSCVGSTASSFAFERICHEKTARVGFSRERGLHLMSTARPKLRAALAMKNQPERCPWVDLSKPDYVAYHDEEWGLPVHDDRRLFEFLTLEAAQAGLSWYTILRKRANYRKAFADFDPQKVARFGPARIEKLLCDPGIVRNRLKIEAAVNNARQFLKVQEEHGSFDAYIWRFVDGQPIVNRIQDPEGVSCPHPAFGRDQPGFEAARVSVRGLDHCLRAHAGHRHGERPFPRVFPSGGVAGPVSYGPGLPTPRARQIGFHGRNGATHVDRHRTGEHNHVVPECCEEVAEGVGFEPTEPPLLAV